MVPSRHSILLEATPRFAPQRHCLFSSFHVFVTSCPTFHVAAHPFLLVPHFYDLLNISVSLLLLFNAWSVPPSRDELFQLNLQDSRQLRDSVLCSVHFINDSCLFESYSDPRTQSQYSRRPWKILTIVIIPILRMKTLRVRKVSSSSKGTEPTSLQLKLTSVPSCVLSIAFVVYPKFKCVSSVFISYVWQPHVWLSYGLWIALSLGTLPLHVSFQQMELYPASGSRTFHRVFSTLIHWKMST